MKAMGSRPGASFGAGSVEHLISVRCPSTLGGVNGDAVVEGLAASNRMRRAGRVASGLQQSAVDVEHANFRLALNAEGAVRRVRIYVGGDVQYGAELDGQGLDVGDEQSEKQARHQDLENMNLA